MKRLLIFVLLGPILFVLCIWFLFLPLASLLEGGDVRFNIEVESNLTLLLGLMVGGLALAAADWVADMLVMRPWFTALIGWALHRPQRRSHLQAQRSLLVPDRHRRSGGDGPLLERHRRQWRRGERVRLVQGQVGHLLADHAARLDRSDGGRRR
jgi:hypothetical protein